MYEESESDIAETPNFEECTKTNKNTFEFPEFPSGNLAYADLYESNNELNLEVSGAPDLECDKFPKCWLYFSLSILSLQKRLRITFRNANSIAKFQRNRKYQPYMVCRTETKEWTIVSDVTLTFNSLRNGVEMTACLQLNEGVFNQPKQTNYQFAINFPYTLGKLQQFLKKAQHEANASCHISSKTVAQSTQNHDILLTTITAKANIVHNPQDPETVEVKKEVPCILITARVHPSEVQSSYFVQKLIKFLTQDKNVEAEVLLQNFAVFIFPMMNPDGVEKGLYRLDLQNKNLNRFYGNSTKETPSIQAVEKLLLQLNCRVMLYLDIHGHSSPKKSFIFGNYTEENWHSIENRVLCRLIEKKFKEFSFQECDFSKKNIQVKERYDQFSKMGSGRAYVGKRDLQKESKTIFHSYTLQVCPYIRKKCLKSTAKSITSFQDQMRQFAEAVCSSVLDICGLCPSNRWDVVNSLRKLSLRELPPDDNPKISIYEKGSQIKKQREPTDVTRQYIDRWLTKNRMLGVVKNSKKLKLTYKCMALFSFFQDLNYCIFLDGKSIPRKSDTRVSAKGILENQPLKENQEQSKPFLQLKKQVIKAGPTNLPKAFISKDTQRFQGKTIKKIKNEQKQIPGNLSLQISNSVSKNRTLANGESTRYKKEGLNNIIRMSEAQQNSEFKNHITKIKVKSSNRDSLDQIIHLFHKAEEEKEGTSLNRLQLMRSEGKGSEISSSIQKIKTLLNDSMGSRSTRKLKEEKEEPSRLNIVSLVPNSQNYEQVNPVSNSSKLMVILANQIFSSQKSQNNSLHLQKNASDLPKLNISSEDHIVHQQHRTRN